MARHESNTSSYGFQGYLGRPRLTAQAYPSRVPSSNQPKFCTDALTMGTMMIIGSPLGFTPPDEPA